MSELLDHLLTRRSVQAAFLEAPAPSEAEVEVMLTAAARVPDHKKLAPWRFLRFDAAGAKRLGDVVAERWLEIEPRSKDERVEVERARFTRAPLVIAVVSSPNLAAPVPVWEQVLSAGAVCMNLVHAAHGSGFAAQWLTEWYAFDAPFLKVLGLGPDEQIAGFIHIGTAAATPADRDRPNLSDIVSYWQE
ncbi:Nitroreductase [Cohaesibacter sp. ES.047]|uniref:nitroreductase family protein n=1 Tax=Cohaesibacter sp. ES.047 TaxID=1798205 RepID=UPI000BB94E59|nr:nitroreductase [Cohaesibacter sp. ES.047]SNY94166.1 Nitroreductase [Cohaesibacter sp. ES.047]